MNAVNVHSIAVVVPVYLGAETIERLTDELLKFRTKCKTPLGSSFVLTELVFAHDCGPDNSDDIILNIAIENPGFDIEFRAFI